MTRSRMLLAADAVFVLANVIGGVSAVVNGEFRHAVSHVMLIVIGAALAWVIAPKNAVDGAPGIDLNDSLTRLQHSLDAVALEVERIGEGQRYVTHLMNADGVSPVADSRPLPTQQR